jgi:hypothetical protein
MGRKYKMRDFTWNYFSMTGDLDAYLLYKEINQEDTAAEASEENELDTIEDE